MLKLSVKTKKSFELSRFYQIALRPERIFRYENVEIIKFIQN